MEFLHDYSGLPQSLLDSLRSYRGAARAPIGCNADTSDCSKDGVCTDSSPSCKTDTSDCRTDGASCSRDSPCSSDGVCRTDGVCTYDIPVVRPSGTGKITLVSVTETSVTITLKSISNANIYHVVYRLASETAVKFVDTYSTTVTITGLSPGTKYAINYYGINSAGNNGFMSTPFYVTTLSSVKKWSWSASNGSASAAATRAAYSAVSNRGRVRDFSYVVWNDMADKVKEILDAKNLGWNTRFLSFSATKMSSGDRTLTAARFNSLRYNIGLHYSTGINTVSRGDIVYGWYFTQLTYCMNQWIDQS